MILAYHKGTCNSAHDIGSGGGIVTAQFLIHHFRTINLSDPSAHNLDSARRTLTDLQSSAKPDSIAAKAKLTCSQTPAEVANPHVTPGSQDLVTIFQALHWTRPPSQAIALAAESLRPGGTLALLHYAPRVILPNSAKADRAWNRVMDAHSRAIHLNPEDTASGRSGHPLSDAGLDYVTLPPELFDRAETRRVYLNTHLRTFPSSQPASDERTPEEQRADTEMPFAKSRTAIMEDWFPRAESGIHADEEIMRMEDTEAWGRDVDAGWFKPYVETLQPGFDTEAEDVGKDFEEIREGIEEETRSRAGAGITSTAEDSAKAGSSPNKPITRVVWLVNIVLATKK